MNGKKPNRYLILCPTHGEMICYRCEVIRDDIANLCGCEECNAIQKRREKAWQKHLDEYDHSAVAEV